MWDKVKEVWFVLHTLNPLAYTCKEPHDFCIAAMVAVFFFVFGSDFYRVGVVYMNTCSLLLCFHPKPSFLMHEGYVLWDVKLQILKQILYYIMLKYLCVLYHLQLYDTIHVMVLE